MMIFVFLIFQTIDYQILKIRITVFAIVSWFIIKSYSLLLRLVRSSGPWATRDEKMIRVGWLEAGGIRLTKSVLCLYSIFHSKGDSEKARNDAAYFRNFSPYFNLT